MRILAALDRFNQRHPWSHNDRFLGWVEHRVAASGAREVLDVAAAPATSSTDSAATLVSLMSSASSPTPPPP